MGIKKLQISVLYEVFIYQLRIVFCGSDLWFFVIFRMRPPAEIFTDKLTGNKIKIFEINSLKRFPLILRISKQDMKTCTKNNDTKWLRIKILLVEKIYLSTARATVSDKVLNSVANSEIQILNISCFIYFLKTNFYHENYLVLFNFVKSFWLKMSESKLSTR